MKKFLIGFISALLLIAFVLMTIRHHSGPDQRHAALFRNWPRPPKDASFAVERKSIVLLKPSGAAIVWPIFTGQWR